MIRVVRQEVLPKNAYEYNNGKKITIPDQVEGVNEMLARFRRGEVSAKRSVYNNDNELPDLRKLDLVDVDQLKRDLNNTIGDEKTKQKQIRKTYDDTKKRIIESKNNPANPPAGFVPQPNPNN